MDFNKKWRPCTPEEVAAMDDEGRKNVISYCWKHGEPRCGTIGVENFSIKQAKRGDGWVMSWSDEHGDPSIWLTNKQLDLPFHKHQYGRYAYGLYTERWVETDLLELSAIVGLIYERAWELFYLSHPTDVYRGYSPVGLDVSLDSVTVLFKEEDCCGGTFWEEHTISQKEIDMSAIAWATMTDKMRAKRKEEQERQVQVKGSMSKAARREEYLKLKKEFEDDEGQ